jgi:ferrous iron transport protein A
MQPINELKNGQTAIITQLLGGPGFEQRLRCMGIREGKEVRMVAHQPMKGPVVISIDGRETTIGRSMAQRIMVRLLS